MAVGVPSAANEALISIEYDETALLWATMYDNHVVAWIVDEAEPQSFEPAPRVIGQLPTAAPDTAPVQSPQWALVLTSGTVYVPDQVRLPLAQFFDWLASNGGARRQLRGVFSQNFLVATWNDWAAKNPGAVWRG
jgi:hypothetical protein